METKKTMMFGGAAVVLMLLAWITAPRPVTPDEFSDVGKQFFPEFNDPSVARSLEVVTWDEQTGSAIPFKVVNQNGNWSIPSHFNYPADGAERLAKVAAGMIGVTRDDYRGRNSTDYQAFGVIDPMEEGAAVEGRGQRITIRGENEVVLADLIVGKAIPDREGLRYVRKADEKQVYAARLDLELTTKFSDWIDADLLMVDKNNIDRVEINNYSINERSGTIRQGEKLVLNKDGSTWKMDGMRAAQEVNITEMNNVLAGIDELAIVGVRPKPAGLSASLKGNEEAIRISDGDVMDLQSKGYFFSRDGSLVSNEGELEVETNDGVVYTLRFGEVAPGTGLAVSSGVGADAVTEESSASNRYLFITANFDRERFKEPRMPANTDFQSKADSLWSNADRENKTLYDAHQAWVFQIASGEAKVSGLVERFADWYYVISEKTFEKLRKDRSKLLKNKTNS